MLSKETHFTEGYYPLVEDQPVKNTYDFSNNIIVTGPNASGKTTLLKATMFNIILSQQIGFGYYDKAILKYMTNYIVILIFQTLLDVIVCFKQKQDVVKKF